MVTQMREVKYKTAQYMRVVVFPVRKEGGKKSCRAARANPTREVQAALNQRNASRMLSDIIHLNFTPDDCAIHPTYSEDFLPKDDDEAFRNIINYIRRLRRAYVRVNGDAEGFKYLYVIEKTKTGRYHYHMVISAPGLTYKQMIECWGMGRCNPRPLEFDESGVVGLAHYMVKDPVGSRRWGCSKGLARPAPRTNDTRFSQKDAAALCGANPDLSRIEGKYYEGWKISDVETVVTVTGTFIEMFLYRENNEYFWRDRWGRIHYGARPK